MAILRSLPYLIISFAVAILLITFGPKWADRFSHRYDQTAAKQAVVAKINELEGNASRRSYGEENFQDLTATGDLYNLDTVQIQSRGKMQITSGGYKLVVQGPGLFVLESWNNSVPDSPVVLHMISGQMYLISEGTPGKLYVVRGGEMLDPKGAGILRERSLLITPLNVGEPAPITEPTSATAPMVTRPVMNPVEADPDEEKRILTNDYLDGEIAKQQDQFQRCQNNALREQGEAKGQIMVGLTILPQGKVSQARILTSSITNPQLHSCVIQVFYRMKFNAFEGAPIIRSYPLNFE
ncbi:MAG: AgmX/PglI C-terminal domain-containing protein [Bdellovibrionales bacterium]